MGGNQVAKCLQRKQLSDNFTLRPQNTGLDVKLVEKEEWGGWIPYETAEGGHFCHTAS